MKSTLEKIDVRHRPQAWKAYKRILQHTQARGLRTGDRLPTQPELCKSLGLCTNTFQAAMSALVADGAVTSKQRVGTVMADTGVVEKIPWTIGVVLPYIAEGQRPGFTVDLAVRVQVALNRAGCHSTVHHSPSWNVAPVTNEDLKNYDDGLTRDLLREDVDGLVTLASARPLFWSDVSTRVPYCHTHWAEHSPAGVIVDQGAWAREAVSLLVGRGCRKLAAGARTARFQTVGRFWEGFDRGVAAIGLPPERGETLTIPEIAYQHLDHIAPALVRELLARPRHDRPDGLVLDDDYVAAQLAFILRETTDYRPLIASQVNRHLPRLFALPVFEFEVDSDELARRTVRLLLERVKNPAVAERIDWYIPRLVQPEVKPSFISKTFTT